MPHHYNRPVLTLSLALLVMLTGCRSNIRRAKPVDVTMPTSPDRPLEVNSLDRARYDEAVELLKSGELLQAQAAFEELERDASYIPGVHLNLALIHHQKQDYPTSRRHLDEALRLSPRNALAHNLDGSLLRRGGKFKEAQVAYAKALTIDPDYASAHFNMALLFDIYLQYWIDAREHYKRYQKLIESPDETVESWLRDLEVRIKQAGD